MVWEASWEAKFFEILRHLHTDLGLQVPEYKTLHIEPGQTNEERFDYRSFFNIIGLYYELLIGNEGSPSRVAIFYCTEKSRVLVLNFEIL